MYLLKNEPASYKYWQVKSILLEAKAKASLIRAFMVSGYRPEPERSNHVQDEAWVTPSGGPNRPMLKNRRMRCG